MSDTPNTPDGSFWSSALTLVAVLVVALLARWLLALVVQLPCAAWPF